MKERIITALIIIAVVLPPLLWGGWLLDILIFAFVSLGAYEILDVRQKETPKWVLAVLILLMIGLFLLPNEFLTAGLIVALILLYFTSICFSWFSVEDVGLVYCMMNIVVFAVKCIRAVYQITPQIMIFILLATYLTDTGAYFSGYFFGKHKLNPRISPKKTIEGSLGGWLLGAAGSFLFAYFCLQGILPLEMMIAGSIFMPIIGQIGDLALSAVKRYYKVKDFGKIFPGHGGVLDRIDSLLFNLLLFYILMIGMMI